MVIPAGFEYLEGVIDKFRDEYPHFDRNVFIMMPFSSNVTEAIYDTVSTEVEAHGLIPLRADMRTFAPVLWWNVVTYMIGSAYGIVIYKQANSIPFNPNVSIEAGFMMALDRPVLLLAEDELKGLPVDFSGHIYKTFSPQSIPETVEQAVKDWIERDLSYYNYGNKKVIVFVSIGGTCRCVMAKGILSQRLHDMKISNVAVEAAAIADPHKSSVSPSAIKALQEIGCDHWLIGHRPRKLCRYLQNRADLIIALTDRRLARTPASASKVIADRELFGERIMNPYPDKEDLASLEKYRASRQQLENALDRKLDDILKLIQATPTI